MSDTVKAIDLVRNAENCLGMPYKYGHADAGAVDCSGLVVYLMGNLNGRKPYHGTNSMYRLDMVGGIKPMSEVKPGYICFKRREWRENQKGNKWFGKEPGDVYHCGIMGRNNKVINAANVKLGVIESDIQGWDCCAMLKGVDYSDGSVSTFDALIDEIYAVLDKYREEGVTV